jgi:hypothetical protein
MRDYSYVFVVLCRYQECSECGGNGAHVVGVCRDSEDAKRLASDHESNNSHSHYVHTEVETYVLK